MLAIGGKVAEAMAPVTKSIATAAETMRPMLFNIPSLTAPTIRSDFMQFEPTFSPMAFVRPKPVVHTTVIRVVRREELEDVVESAVTRVFERVRPAQKMSSCLLPVGAVWEKLQIKFVDGHNVKVKYPGTRTSTFNYKELGCQNDKTNNPDTKWEFLRVLAHGGGNLSVSNFDSRFGRQAKYELSKRLRDFFGLAEDPFYPYKKRSGYSIKLVLLSDTDPLAEDDYSEVSFDA